ncbi:RNA polymerase sigma factor [Piscibacillus salipiscarius]|uniref:RNA polymerase sigma factor n=1 Tax=Piscibacillus salipiscarius TaxID=299480 RepID=A0ABW5QAH3_9BACI|nr:RNA polymerase sigma factor [Piscibacillus salipiscarius]
MPIDNLSSLSRDLREIEREFKAKIEPHRSDLWGYCYNLTKSPWDAEDLVQDTLLKSLSVLAKLYQPVKSKSYLFRIATNLWIDQIRKNKLTYNPLDEQNVIDESSENDLHLIENLEVLMNILSPTQYVSLILTEAFGYKGKEVAEIIGTTEGAIHTNLSRTRSKLEKYNAKITDITTQRSHVEKVKPDHTINIMLEGFRNKDTTLISSILDENIVTDITHSGIEFGIEETKKNSLSDWKEIVHNQETIVAEYKMLWGRPVIVELERKLDNQLYLNNVHYVEFSEGKVTYWKFYCFAWDLMKLAANELEVKLNAKYFYNIF